MKNRRQGQSRLLTKKEIQNVVQFQKSSRHSIRNICLINLSIFTGMRVGEIAKLKMADVVNEDLSVKEQLVLRKEYTKSYQTRMVYLVHKDVRKSLTDYMNYRKEFDGNVKSNTPFFVSQKKSGFTPRTLQRLYKNMYKAVIGDGMVSSHSGRRTFICNLVSSGINMKVVSTLAGHSSIQTTMNTYAKSNEIEMEKVCRNISIQ